MKHIGSLKELFMKRRTSGWLAWISLALIIGVPSSEIFLSKIKQDKSVQKGELSENFANKNLDNLHVLNFDTKKSDEQVISEMSSVTARKEKSPAKQVSKAQKQAYSPIPIEFRILGDQTTIVSDANVRNSSNLGRDISNSSTRIVGDVGMTIGSANIILDKQIKEIEEVSSPDLLLYNSSTFKVENGIDEAFLLAQSQENAIAQTSAVEAVKNEIAVISSVNVINVPQKQIFQHVDFYDIVETDRSSIASVSTNNLTRQRLDRVQNNSQSTIEIIKPINQVEFYELHKMEQRSQQFVVNGSFLTQLPATRGSLIRLDMVN